MTIIPGSAQNQRADLTAADALANPVEPDGLFARAFRRAIGWREVRPAALNPSLVGSSAHSRINRDYEALGRS
jgi:hypothetical protein